MISIKVKRNAQSVKDYFKEHLENGEYYSEKGRHDGVWHGAGLKYFNLIEGSKIDLKDFEAFSNGLNPLTGKKLTPRQKEKRRSCYDIVFSAPKSVSIMALLAQDERLITAHHEALDEAFLELEKRAQARVRKGLSLNTDENRFTGNLVSSRFTHRSSRSLDPQLHTHCVVFNVTYDPSEKRMKALQAGEIYECSKYITAVYRNHLASKVKTLGYDIDEGRHGWRIQSLSLEIEELYSKRSEHMKELKAAVEEKKGIRLDNNGLSLLAHASRAEKEKNLSDEDLLILQKEQLTIDQMQTLERLKEKAIVASRVRKIFEISKTSEIKPIMSYALQHAFERKSVIKKEDLLEIALNQSAGRASLKDLLEAFKSGGLIEIGNSISTKEEEKREREILEMIQGSRDTGQALGDSSKIKKPRDKTYEQQYLASTQLLKSRSQFLYLRGKAGAGKTYTLKQLIDSIALPVVLAAPTSSATETLRQEVSANAITIQKLLLNDADQLRGSLLVVDEAGFLSTKEMHHLLSLAKDQNAKILFVGDTRQHTSVVAGDALRLLESHSPIPIAEISTITRQKEARYLETVQALSQGNTSKALDLLQKRGSIRSSREDGTPLGNESRALAVAQEYLSKTKEGLSTLVVTPTWAEHERVTHAIRGILKENGVLSKNELLLKVYQSLNFTAVEKSRAPNFEPGTFLSFHRKHEGFEKGEIWEVTQTTNEKIFIKNRNGEKRSIHPARCARSFDVVRCDEKPFSAGDVILLKANYRGPDKSRLPNGAIKKIEKIDTDGTLHLDGGIKLDPHFRHFLHGYATTSHGSQGKTRDYVIVSADSSASNALSKNQLYVSVSRGIRGVMIFTDDLKRFQKAVEKTADRTLVTEEKTKFEIMKEIFANSIKKFGLKIHTNKTQYEKPTIKILTKKKGIEKGLELD